jgi:hypothetical protein
MSHHNRLTVAPPAWSRTSLTSDDLGKGQKEQNTDGGHYTPGDGTSEETNGGSETEGQ